MSLVLPLALLAGIDTSGVEFRGVEGRIRVPLPRLEQEITVDGVLDESAWLRASRLTGFSQYTPVDGRPAEQNTEILVWYSPHAILFGIRAYAPSGSVKATLADRDKLTGEDLIEIFLDTYNDRRQALVFGVNPLGIQSDGSLAEGAQRSGSDAAGGREATDLSADFVYASKGRLTDFGYEVEVRIPFKTLKYQSAEIQDWGLNVVRRVMATGHEDSWVAASRTIPTFLGQAGTLQGLTGMRRGLVMDLNPVLTARANGAPAEAGWAYDRAVEPGGNVRWGITPNLTLNGTVNPDFSHVEADASQVVTDPRQATFFPEKRPFFLEGIEQFTTPNNLIYTRRIVAPLAATKLTGKTGGTNLAILFAADDEALSVGGEDVPLFAIARVQRDLGSGGRVALVYTDRTEDAVANRVIGSDARVVFGGVTMAGQLAGSATTRDGSTTWAPLWRADLARNGRRFGLSYSFQGISDQFVAGSGFIARRGVTELGFNHALNFYGAPGAPFERTTVSVNLRGRWQYQDFIHGGPIQDRQLFLTGNFRIRGGWILNLTGIAEQFGYDDQLYQDYAIERYQNGVVVDTITPYPPAPPIQNRDLSLTAESPRLGPLSFKVNYIFGRDENFFEWSPANIRIVNATVQLRPTSQLRLDGSYIQQWYQRRTDHSVVGEIHIPRVRLEYQVTRAVFVRAVAEYISRANDDLRDDGRTNDPILIRDPADGVYRRSLALARQLNNLRADFLFSYQPLPGTVFFLGYGGSYTELDRFQFSDLERRTDGFFLKASYLFRL